MVIPCGAHSEAGAGHALAETAGLQEFLFQFPELLVERVVGLMDQADGDVGHGFRGAALNERTIVLIALLVARAELADLQGFAVVWRPFAVVALAEVVFVVAEEFFQAGSSHAGEFDLAFLGRSRHLAAFGDILVAAARGLHHLVVGAGFSVNEAVAEADRGIVNDLGFSVGEKVIVAAMRRDEAGIGLRRPRRRIVAWSGPPRRIGLVGPIFWHNYNPSFLNRLFTSLKWKSNEQSFSSSPFLKCRATSGVALRISTKSASSRPACLTSQVFMAASCTSL